jgi:hypothetical protein
LIGTVAPPLIEFRVPKPSSGAAKPANWNATVTVNPPVARLPAASTATQVTWVVPGANVPPEAGVQTGTDPPLATSRATAA